MHPYHIPEYSHERVASKLRSARDHELVRLAQAAENAQDDDPCADAKTAPRRGFRIPFLNWEVITRPARPASAGR